MTSAFEKLFDNMPDDIKDMIYEKILYPQPKELLEEIRRRKIYNDILVYLDCEKKVKPTIEGFKYALKNYVTDIKKLKKLTKLIKAQKKYLSQ